MSDLIRREDALSKFEKACTCDSVDKNGMKRGEIKTALTWEGIRKILENIPTAEPEQKKGEMEKRDFADMIIYFCQKVSEMNISRKCKMELLGMITAIEMKHDELMPKWISVTEALPKNYEQTICIDSRGKMMIGTYGEYGWTFPCYMTEPVAWMSLPEPTIIGDVK